MLETLQTQDYSNNQKALEIVEGLLLPKLSLALHQGSSLGGLSTGLSSPQPRLDLVSSQVLDKKAALQKLLLDDHEPVDGMPKLYTKLNKDLTNPAWFYVSGSPYQFYPTLRPFIFENFPHGPMIMQNLTVTDIPGLIKMISDNDTVKNFKINQIEKIYGFYPKKKFLTVGDSGQADPEVYGEIFRRHPKFIQCIWIREVQGGNNTDARFAAAFKGVPQKQWKVFSDPAELMGLDVAHGKCK
ncbi:hypothetical protein AA313_de0201601 [Arthrobotrys entomopaga]|nr:hypothetical protein AA313_de0201601 [Arthrobotrys entomopaga]